MAWAASDWHELFTDPHLQALIEQGLQNNTDYQSAQLRVEEAEATLLSAKLAFLPSFALAPQGTVSSFDSRKATQTYSLPVTASWELDVFGRMRNAKKQSKALYAQSQDYRQAVRTQLIAGIANTYYTLLMLDQQLAISRQTEETWWETVASTCALTNAGMANESAVSQMEATYYQVQTSVLDLEEQINQVENSLALLLAEMPRHYERGVLAEQQFPVGFSIGIPVQMLSCRPDVRSARADTGKRRIYGTNAARSAFYPSITLGGSAGWTNSAGFNDCESRQVPGFGSGFADAAALCPRAGHCTVPHSPCPAGGGFPCLPADIAECRQRGERCLDCLADKPIQANCWTSR